MNSIIISGEGTATRFFQDIHQKELIPWRVRTFFGMQGHAPAARLTIVFCPCKYISGTKRLDHLQLQTTVLYLMQRFYGFLAQKDHSIVLFGAPLELDLDDEITAVRRREASYLSSWAGANGLHISHDMISGAKNSEMTVDRSVNEGYTHLVSTFIPVRIMTAAAVKVAKNGTSTVKL
ncbi:hypothetical protein BJV82DRAFT_227147 [Fennellomyces sp. T-0311]|nr:hypothetical protein BJV82DRAFT_227147 [Fennellomyces sp. T-0311]